MARAPVPSLEELQASSDAAAQKAIEVKSQAATSTDQSVIVIAQVTPAPAPADEEAPADQCVVKQCCCGCTLSSGVLILARLDLIGAVLLMLTAACQVALKLNEGKIDKSLEEYNEESKEAAVENHEHEYEQVDVDSVNKAIDLGAVLAPFYVILALISVYFACRGIRAAKQLDAPAALSYYKWRVIGLVCTLVAMLFTPAHFSQVFNLAMSIYFVVVARSFHRQLVHNPDQATPGRCCCCC